MYHHGSPILGSVRKSAHEPPHRVWSRLAAVLACLLASWCAWLSANAQSGSPLVVVLTASGPVAPAMREYIRRGLETAARENAALVVLQLNTPGGSVTVMNDIVQSMRSSAVPVVVYVAPRAAMAASAGTVITMAGHAAAMAPETLIGAASPVGPNGEDLGQTLAAKEQNAILASLDALMARRPPSAVQLAHAAVQSARAASAQQALEAGMVDFIAADLDDLLAKLDGFPVYLGQGAAAQALHTAGASQQELPISWIEQILTVLTDPNIIFLLLAIGVQAVLIELSSPGGWVAGFIGVVCLALAGYGLGVLPVNWFGLIFIVVAFVLFIFDVKAPTHGALTTAGAISLLVGALVLFNSPDTPDVQKISVPAALLISGITAASFFTVLTFGLRAQRAPLLMGAEVLPGRVGVVRQDLAPRGTVQLEGELWSAEADDPSQTLRSGERVKVVHVRGVHLLVKKDEDQA